MLTGLILLAARVAKVGFVTDLRQAVLIGYLTGVAVVMVMSTVERLIGAPVYTTTIVGLIQDLADGVEVNWWAFTIGVGTFLVSWPSTDGSRGFRGP